MGNTMRTAPLGTAERQDSAGDSVPAPGEPAYLLRFEREYGHTVDTVWRYLTEPLKTRQWWAESRIEPNVGGRFDLRWLNGDDGNPLEWWRGTLTEIEPHRVLEHTNSAHGLLRWQLAPTASGTALTFLNTITPPEPRFVTLSLGGWHLHLEHLGAALDGAVIDWPHWYRDFGAHFDDVHARYRNSTGLP